MKKHVNEAILAGKSVFNERAGQALRECMVFYRPWTFKEGFGSRQNNGASLGGSRRSFTGLGRSREFQQSTK
jgi:hypothetical protein